MGSKVYIIFIISLSLITFFIQIGKMGGRGYFLSSQNIIPDNFIGVNGNLTHYSEPWESSSVSGLMNELGVQSLRYPGGVLANVWDWDRGWVYKDIDLSSIAGNLNAIRLNKSTNSLEDLAKGQGKVGFEPLFVVNMITSDLPSTIRQLKKARLLGLPVNRVELGNEFYNYFNTGEKTSLVRQKFDSPLEYIRVANKWAKSIKELFPNCDIAVIAEDFHARAPMDRASNWNRIVIENMSSDIKAISFHPYIIVGLGKYSDVLTKNKDLPEIFHEIEPIVKNKVKYMSNILIENKELWVTEYNIIDFDKKIKGSWAHTLIVGQQLTMFLNHHVMASYYHTLIDAGLFGAAKKVKGKKGYKILNTGRVLKMFSKTIKGFKFFRVIESSYFFGNRSLYGFVAYNDKTQLKSFVVNMSENEVKLESDLFGENFCSTSLSSGLKGFEGDITKKISKTENNKQVSILGHSIFMTDTNCEGY